MDFIILFFSLIFSLFPFFLNFSGSIEAYMVFKIFSNVTTSYIQTPYS